MINYGKQSIDQDDIDAVVKVLKSDFLTQGQVVDDFEKGLSDYFGSKYCCVVSSGTSALHLSGMALGWKPEDVVITTPITFLASANSILYSGATPSFVDINPLTLNIDVQLLENKIERLLSKGQNVKAIIAVDFAGNPCDWKELREIADKYKLQLVNDNCHAIGASYFSDKKYAVKYADIVTQSYHPVKNITTGEGGSILTNNLEIFNKIKLLRTHGISKDFNNSEKKYYPWYYEMKELGYNYRITDFQCALGISQLKKLDLFISRRREIAAEYDRIFGDNDLFVIPPRSINGEHAYHLYPMQINFDKLEISKKDLFSRLNIADINLQVHYIPIHLQPFYIKKFGFKRGQFPISELFYSREVSFPIYYNLSDKEILYFTDIILGILDD